MLDTRKPTDVRAAVVAISYLPVEMRMPLKFGAESVSSVSCIRVAVTVKGKDNRSATGWGETPLSVTWAWPSAEMSYKQRYQAMEQFCSLLGQAWVDSKAVGHPMEIGHAFVSETLPKLLEQFNSSRGEGSMPHLAALIACE